MIVCLESYFVLLDLQFSCVFSIIEMMEEFTNQLDDRVSGHQKWKKLVPDEIALNVEPVSNKEPSCVLENFDCKMAVMMLKCVDSATEESGSNCSSLVKIVRTAATSVAGEFVVMKEAWNSVVVAVGPKTPAESTPFAQLITLAEQVIHKVCAKLKSANKIIRWCFFVTVIEDQAWSKTFTKEALTPTP